MALIAPSILSADFGNLERDVRMLNESLADWLHVDVMDGVFVPNISFGFPVLNAIAKVARKPLDVHLMIIEPEKYVKQFAAAGAALISVHVEACVHLNRTIQEIKEVGVKAGAVLNPHTPVSVLEDIILDVDLVLLMSVNPGFGGQKFIPRTIDKIRALKELIIRSGSKAMIQVDGGVNGENAGMLILEGADVLVAGNYIFSSVDPLATIASLKSV